MKANLTIAPPSSESKHSKQQKAACTSKLTLSCDDSSIQFALGTISVIGYHPAKKNKILRSYLNRLSTYGSGAVAVISRISEADESESTKYTKFRILRCDFEIEKMKAIIEELASAKLSEIVVIDYLQLMRSTSKVGTRAQQLAHCICVLSEVAKKYQLAIVVLSQMNQNKFPESRLSERNIRELADFSKVRELMLACE